MKEQREKPLRDALDFQHDIERVRGKFADLADDSFPLGYAVAILRRYEQAIRAFLGEDAHDDEEEQV